MLMPKRTSGADSSAAAPQRSDAATRSHSAISACRRSSRARFLPASSRRVVSRAAGTPLSKVWIRVFPHKSITKKPAETRQGSGKGDVDFWAAVVKPGTVIYELGGVSEEVAKRAFNRVAHKLPVKVRLVRRRPN